MLNGTIFLMKVNKIIFWQTETERIYYPQILSKIISKGCASNKNKIVPEGSSEIKERIVKK